MYDFISLRIKNVLLLLALIILCPVAVHAAEDDILDLDLASLMQIKITSAGRKAQLLTDTPAAVYVITDKDLHDSGVTSIPEALRMVPGLQVARISSSKWAITSRGFDSLFANKLLVQIDGRSVYSPGFSGTNWGVQNVMLEDVDRIEVIRGPGATLWGANAVNGVINIITKQASDTQGGYLSLGGGNQERELESVRYGFQLSPDSYGRVYASRHVQDDNRFFVGGEDSRDGWEMNYGGVRLDGDVGLADSWTVQSDFYQGEINQRDDTYWVPTSTIPQQVEDTFRPVGVNLLGRWTHEDGDQREWSLQAYYDYTHRDELCITQIYHVADVDFQQRINLEGRHDIVWGLGFRMVKDEFDNSSQLTLTPDSRTDTLYSLFVQDEIPLPVDSSTLTLGSKFEHNDYTGFDIQPSIRLFGKPSERQSLWAAVSRAVRTPSRAEDSAQVITRMIEPAPSVFVPVYISGNPSLDSEVLMAYEAGYRFAPDETLAFDLTAFFNDYDKLISYRPTASGLEFNNFVDGQTWGIELGSEWKPCSWLETEFSYSYIAVDLNALGLTDPAAKAVVEANFSPRHQASLRTGVKLSRKLKLNLWARYVSSIKEGGSTTLMPELTVDQYVTLDGNLSWQFNRGMELMLVGQNLFDNRRLEFIQERFTSPIEIERSLYAKLNWKF